MKDSRVYEASSDETLASLRKQTQLGLSKT